MKLCECGCGNPAPLARCSDPSRGWVKGEPIRFIRWHHLRPFPSGDQHPRWAGEDVGYATNHSWLKRFPKTGICSECGIRPKPFRNMNVGTDWANLSGSYIRDRSDYIELCRSCHRKFDYANYRSKGIILRRNRSKARN